MSQCCARREAPPDLTGNAQPPAQAPAPSLQREVTFHVPRVSLCCQGLGRRGLSPPLPPMWQRTQPQRFLLQMVGPQDGGGRCTTLLFRAVPGHTLWQTQPPGARSRAPGFLRAGSLALHLSSFIASLISITVFRCANIIAQGLWIIN